MTNTTECENCGSTNVSTDPVRRVYLDPEAPGDPESATIGDDVEAWCAACVANYPHQVATAT